MGYGRKYIPSLPALESRVGICRFFTDLQSNTKDLIKQVPKSSDLFPENASCAPRFKFLKVSAAIEMPPLFLIEAEPDTPYILAVYSAA